MGEAFYKRRFLFIPLMVAAFLALISFAVMQLWNGVLTDVLHVSTVNYWQAMGIFVLCKILFGFGRGGRFGGGAPWMRGRMGERFKNMSQEEREKFKEQFADRMCHGRGRKGFRDWPEEEKKPSDEMAD
jgi:hypothetical protein